MLSTEKILEEIHPLMVLDHPLAEVGTNGVATRAVPLVSEKAPGCPNLSKSLAEARDRCKAAIKDGWNDYHKFKYASADNVIGTASDALEGSGLAIIPASQDLVAVGSGGATIYCLNRTFILSHESGEYVPIKANGWPVMPDRGKPLDKAFAIALTSSLAYMLRDLLQMPRGESGEANARTDAPPAPDEKVQKWLELMKGVYNAEPDKAREAFEKKKGFPIEKATDAEIDESIATLEDELKKKEEKKAKRTAGETA